MCRIMISFFGGPSLSKKLSKIKPLLKDERVLKNLLKLEKICVPVSEDYLRSGIQPDLNPSYRKIVTDWMLQVRYFEKQSYLGI